MIDDTFQGRVQEFSRGSAQNFCPSPKFFSKDLVWLLNSAPPLGHAPAFK